MNKHLSPWIRSGNSEHHGAIRKTLRDICVASIYKSNSSITPYYFYEISFRRFERLEFRSIDEAKDKYDSLLVEHGYILLTQDEYNKFLLLR